MSSMLKLLVAAGAAMAISTAAMAGGLCGGKAHEVSVPTETVSTDSATPMTVADSQTVSAE